MKVQCGKNEKFASHQKLFRQINSVLFIVENVTFTKFLPKISKLLHTVEKSKIYSHQKMFRQINYLVISLVNTLVSRNFCQNRVRVNFRIFHTVCAACCVIIFWEKCRESNGFTKEEITIELI